MRIEVLRPEDPRIWELVLRFKGETKYDQSGHVWWVYKTLLSRPDAVHLVVVDESGSIRGFYSFVSEGKDEALLLIALSDGGLVGHAKLLRSFLRKLGIKKCYTHVWGPYKRALAVERLMGAKTVAHLVEMEV
ncbi:MAG: hypothetical protein NZ902_06535 [Acidilobaceae archaeon]|nr:hypothetical protein [Acidilobaceae archaeon]MDW7974880.1 hypothetical protein [Sulfolobales archaeon]